MSARSRAVQKVLAEARGALAFGRTHLVVIGDREIIRQLPEMLREKLRGEIDTVTVRLAGQNDSVADSVAAAIREARREAAENPGRSAEPGVPVTRQRQALLLPDALAIPASSLRSLHEIATHLGSHRLVLFVDRDANGLDDPVAELVARLGAGVSTIEVEPPPEPIHVPTLEDLLRGPEAAPAAARAARPEEAAPLAASASPEPAAPVERNASARDEAEKADPAAAGHGHPEARRVWPMLAVAAALGALVVVVGVPGLVETVESVETIRRELGIPDASRGSAPPDDEATPARAEPAEPEVAALEGSGPPLPPAKGGETAARAAAEAPSSSSAQLPTRTVSAPKPEPERKPQQARPKAPEKAPAKARAAVAKAKPAPAAPLVSVNFNAVPWADLVVDGRKLGPTPLANIRLSAGEHRVLARFPDGRVVERSIRVEPGRTRFQIQ